MKIRFNRADKSITFLDGTETINANDVMYQYLEVEVIPALSTSESLWVVFKNEEYGEYSNEILIADSGTEAKAAIPEEVIVAGEWTLQLLVRKYLTSDPARYIQKGSEIAPFTVTEGLKTTLGQNVNNATAAALYTAAKELIENTQKNDEAIGRQSEAIAENAENIAQNAADITQNAAAIAKGQESVTDLSLRVESIDIQLNRFSQTTLPVMEQNIANIGEGLITAQSDIEGLRKDVQNEAHFKGYVADNAIFNTLVGDVNDYAYSSEDGFIWVHNGTLWEKTEKEAPDGAVPLGNATPLADGEGSPGESTNASREDHRHPTDETRASAQDLTTLSDRVNRLHGAASPTVLTVGVAEGEAVTFTAQQPGAAFIDWGDGGITTEFNDLPSHTYETAGVYEIKIFDATALVGSGLAAILGYDASAILKKLVVGDSVTAIGGYAFYNSQNLKYVTLSDSVTSIGSAAFYECRNLAKVIVGSGVENIEGAAFYYAPAVLQLTAEAPPSITSYTFEETEDTLILVPHGSVEAYRSAEYWTSLAAQITANAMLSDLDGFVKDTDLLSITDMRDYSTPFLDINLGVKNELLKRFFGHSLLIGNTHYADGYIRRDGYEFHIPRITKYEVAATQSDISSSEMRFHYVGYSNGAKAPVYNQSFYIVFGDNLTLYKSDGTAVISGGKQMFFMTAPYNSWANEGSDKVYVAMGAYVTQGTVSILTGSIPVEAIQVELDAGAYITEADSSNTFYVMRQTKGEKSNDY